MPGNIHHLLCLHIIEARQIYAVMDNHKQTTEFDENKLFDVWKR